MSKSQCLSADWTQVGFKVGVSGNVNPEKSFTKRQTTCAKHGAVAVIADFKDGYQQGMAQYCHVDNSVLLGIKGDRHAVADGVCPDNELLDFRTGFDAGYRLYELKRRLYDTDSTQNELDSRKYRYQRELRSLREQLGANDVEAKDRQYRESRYNHLRQNIYRINDQIRYHQQQVYHYRADVEDYENFLRIEYPESFNFVYQPPF